MCSNTPARPHSFMLFYAALGAKRLVRRYSWVAEAPKDCGHMSCNAVANQIHARARFCEITFNLTEMSGLILVFVHQLLLQTTSCKRLLERIINHCAVLKHLIHFQTHGSITQTALLEHISSSPQYLKQYASTNAAPGF